MVLYLYLSFGIVKMTAVIHKCALRTGNKFLRTSDGKIKRLRSREIRNQMWWLVEADNLCKRTMLMADSGGRPIVGIAGTNPAETWISVSLGDVCCQVEVSSYDWSLAQRSPTECGMSECESEASIMRQPWHTSDSCAGRRGDYIRGVSKI
jgi:hypothetical protein